jgi:hypothetical protein
MAILGSFILILTMLCQSGPIPANEDDIFSATEISRLKTENSVELRIKIYQAASMRTHKNLQQSVSKEEFETVPETLKIWASLLAQSLEDVETNLKAKKKPRNLISYEIHLRKAISSMQSCKIKAPADQQDAFDSWLAQTESIRKKFVEILFNLKS